MNKEKYIGEAALNDKPDKKLTLVIKDGSVTTPKIADENVTTEKVADEAITTSKVAEQAITDSKLGDSAIVERTINKGAVTAPKIALGAVETDKIADENVTSEKLADDSVTTNKIKDESVTTEKLAESSVVESKIQNGAVTNDKIANDTLTRDKLDPELRSTLDAATGLPEDLMETIQNVDKTLKDHQDQLNDKQSQIDDKQQQIISNDEDISLLQTRSTQMEEAIKGISASGGASVASAVTYDNTESGLDSITAQGAIDELANKKFDKENIAQEFGESEDKVVSQFALPFREIESPEFIKAIVDSEDHFLFGIQLDGSIEWGKGIPAPIRAKLQEIISQCQQDKTDILESINAAKEELSASIAALQEGKVDKEEGKSLIEDEVKECFRVIENEEFIKAIVDSEDKVLFGFHRATGKPYYPLNDMYHVEQNKEFFALWLDTEDHILLGIRRDGQIIGEIHAVNALKQVISQLKSDLASLQEDIKVFLDIFSLQENPEFLAVEKDAEGKVLSATNTDGSHYIHNAKSETIPTEFEHIDDPEGRTEITTDAENKILGYRDSEGTRHEHKISVNHLELSDEAATEVNEAFKSAGIKMENPSDFSKDSHIELPIPRIAAQVRIYAPKLPTTKQDDIEAEIEYNDKDGNYFRKPVILNAQGSSSMSYYVKNMAIDINDGSEIKFGDFPTQDSFHLKKYYIDAFRGQCIVGYWLMEQVYQTRKIGNRYPYEFLLKNNNAYTGNGIIEKDFHTGGKCHPDGFPIIITWINSDTGKETWMGVYAWNLKKSKEVYHADKKKADNIILDGITSIGTLFGGTINWTAFEIRNPKSLKDVNGDKYDGDNPKELSGTDEFSKKVKDFIVRLSNAYSEIKSNNTKNTFEKFFLVKPFIDYYLVSQIIYNVDGFMHNWIWVTYNGLLWCPTLYDVDSIFGMHPNGAFIFPESDKNGIVGTNDCFGIEVLYSDEINARYKELRDKGIFDIDNIVNLLNSWIERIGYYNMKKELSEYNETPSYRASNISSGWKLLGTSNLSGNEYLAEKEYNIGEKCSFYGYLFESQKLQSGNAPLSKIYSKAPIACGFFNSISRVQNWLSNRISYLDKMYNYK